MTKNVVFVYLKGFLTDWIFSSIIIHSYKPKWFNTAFYCRILVMPIGWSIDRRLGWEVYATSIVIDS